MTGRDEGPSDVHSFLSISRMFLDPLESHKDLKNELGFIRIGTGRIATSLLSPNSRYSHETEEIGMTGRDDPPVKTRHRQDREGSGKNERGLSRKVAALSLLFPVVF